MNMKKPMRPLLMFMTMVILLSSFCGFSATATDSASETTAEDGTVTLYLVRHGKTIMNTLDLCQGWADSPLTQAGVEVAKDTGIGLSDTIFDYVYSSDRERAIQTAEIILSENTVSGDLTINTVEGLRETCFGSYEGRSFPQLCYDTAVYRGYKDADEMMSDPNYNPTTLFSDVPALDKTGMAETHERVVMRLTRSIDKIVSTASAQGGGSVLVVGHGSSLLTAISELTDAKELPLYLSNASVSKIVWKDGTYTLEYINNTEFAEQGAAVRKEQEMPVTIYLAQHGKTLFNKTGQTQGWIDSPLTDVGREAAVDLGKGLSDITFSAIYTSGMGRTYETAGLVLEENPTSSDLTIMGIEGLRDANYGKYEGSDYDDMIQAALDYYGVSSYEELGNEEQSAFEQVLYHNYISDESGMAENYFELLYRVNTAFNQVVKETSENGGGNILMISHGNAIMAILAELGVEGVDHVDNAGITKIIYQNGKYIVESVNDLSYIETSTAK